MRVVRRARLVQGQHRRGGRGGRAGRGLARGAARRRGGLPAAGRRRRGHAGRARGGGAGRPAGTAARVTGPGGGPLASRWLELPGRHRRASSWPGPAGCRCWRCPTRSARTAPAPGSWSPHALDPAPRGSCSRSAGRRPPTAGPARWPRWARGSSTRAARSCRPAAARCARLASADLSGLRPPPPGGVTLPDRRARAAARPAAARPPCSARRRAPTRRRSRSWRRAWPGWPRVLGGDPDAPGRRAPRAAPATASRPRWGADIAPGAAELAAIAGLRPGAGPGRAGASPARAGYDATSLDGKVTGTVLAAAARRGRCPPRWWPGSSRPAAAGAAARGRRWPRWPAGAAAAMASPGRWLGCGRPASCARGPARRRAPQP